MSCSWSLFERLPRVLPQHSLIHCQSNLVLVGELKRGEKENTLPKKLTVQQVSLMEIQPRFTNSAAVRVDWYKIRGQVNRKRCIRRPLSKMQVAPSYVRTEAGFDTKDGYIELPPQSISRLNKMADILLREMAPALLRLNGVLPSWSDFTS